MPPRRSSRTPSVQPASKPPSMAAATRTAESQSHANGLNGVHESNKRNLSPERPNSPPAKRLRSNSKKPDSIPPTGTRKPPSRTATKKSSEVAARKSKKLSPVREAEPVQEPKPEHKQLKPYINQLPAPPQTQRPGLLPFVWGTGDFGQFGLGPDVIGEIPKPRRNGWMEKKIDEGAFGEPGAGIEFVAAGGLHTVFIDEKGAVWTCGANDNAALGRVTENIPDPNTAGGFLDGDDLTTYPYPIQSLVEEGFRAVKAVAGDSICGVISDKGDLRVWGTFRGDEGLLGFSSGLKQEFHPVSILELSHKPGDYEKVASVAAGANHLVVLTTHGSIYTWGAGEQAQLGRKVLERRKIHGTVPEKVTLGGRGRKAVVVGAGEHHSFAVDDKGDVWAWGLNSMGQTGTGWESTADNIVQLPTKVDALSKAELGDDVVVQIEGGYQHTLFLTQLGRVYACGIASDGQLGLADEAFKERPNRDFISEPALVEFPDLDDPVIQISCGIHSNGAVTRGGALYTWGRGVIGELGLEGKELVRTPHIVVRKEGGAWFAAAVACGGQHTIGLFRKKVNGAAVTSTNAPQND